MRRKDREILDTKQIKEVILACDCCRLGFSDGRGVYIVPLNFGYAEKEDKKVFYFHGAKEGRKIELIKKNGYAGFELDTAHKIKGEECPCEFSFFFQSIIGEGPVYMVEEPEEKETALRSIMEHYSNTGGWEFKKELANVVSVFKLEVETMACKEHR